MENYKAIPDGYLTVGEIAKKAGVTVRTLQYYDKEVALLHQILSLKYLGFTLDEIKSYLPDIQSPKEALVVLEHQVNQLTEKLDLLTESVDVMKQLMKEVSQMDTLDWKKYADVLMLLRAQDQSFQLLKEMPENVYDKIRHMDKDEAEKIRLNFKSVLEIAGKNVTAGLPTDSEEAQLLAEKFWKLVMDFTQGDLSLLSELTLLKENDDQHWQTSMNYIEEAVDIYFQKKRINPF